jgi:hypothetical protein
LQLRLMVFRRALAVWAGAPDRVANSHHPITDPQPTDRFAASFSSDAAAAVDGHLWTAVQEYQCCDVTSLPTTTD